MRPHHHRRIQRVRPAHRPDIHRIIRAGLQTHETHHRVVDAVQHTLPQRLRRRIQLHQPPCRPSQTQVRPMERERSGPQLVHVRPARQLAGGTLNPDIIHRGRRLAAQRAVVAPHKDQLKSVGPRNVSLTHCTVPLRRKTRQVQGLATVQRQPPLRRTPITHRTPTVWWHTRLNTCAVGCQKHTQIVEIALPRTTPIVTEKVGTPIQCHPAVGIRKAGSPVVVIIGGRLNIGNI